MLTSWAAQHHTAVLLVAKLRPRFTIVFAHADVFDALTQLLCHIFPELSQHAHIGLMFSCRPHGGGGV